jgi:hypothetical protein
MKEIKEFTQEYINLNSSREGGLFHDFVNSKEPYQSIFKNNPWMIPPDLNKPLE